jgi:hypothetical protein
MGILDGHIMAKTFFAFEAFARSKRGKKLVEWLFSSNLS